MSHLAAIESAIGTYHFIRDISLTDEIGQPYTETINEVIHRHNGIPIGSTVNNRVSGPFVLRVTGWTYEELHYVDGEPSLYDIFVDRNPFNFWIDRIEGPVLRNMIFTTAAWKPILLKSGLYILSAVMESTYDLT